MRRKARLSAFSVRCFLTVLKQSTGQGERHRRIDVSRARARLAMPVTSSSWGSRKVETGFRRLPVAEKTLSAQPVDATPSDMNLFSKGGVYDARETGEAFCEPADGHVGPLEGGTVVTRDRAGLR